MITLAEWAAAHPLETYRQPRNFTVGGYHKYEKVTDNGAVKWIKGRYIPEERQWEPTLKELERCHVRVRMRWMNLYEFRREDAWREATGRPSLAEENAEAMRLKAESKGLERWLFNYRNRAWNEDFST